MWASELSSALTPAGVTPVVNPTLFLVLVAVLGVLVGAALELIFARYMRWVRRTKEPWMIHAWRGLFTFMALPSLILPLVLAGLTPGRLSDLAEGEAYLLGFLAGFLGTTLYRFLRSRR